MSEIQINAQTAQFHPELLEFFEEQQKNGTHDWYPGTYSYQKKQYLFEQPIHARKRDKNKGYAYEIIPPESSAEGAFGEVYFVDATISRGKNGEFQVKNHNRILKYQEPSFAKREYKILQKIPHLKAKEPLNGNLVMKRMPGIELASFLRNSHLSMPHLLALTKSLIASYQEQVVKNNAIHRDLHHGNIMIDYNPNAIDPFRLNVIDFGCAKLLNSTPKVSEADDDLKRPLKSLWSYRPYVPKLLQKAFHTSFWEPPANLIKTCNWLLIAPTEETQPTMDRLNQYLIELSTQEKHKKLARTLYQLIFAAAAKCHERKMHPLNQAIKKCKTLLDEQQIGKNFAFMFFVSVQKQKALEKIFVLLEQLEQEGAKLAKGKKHAQQGERQQLFISNFREELFYAVHLPKEQVFPALKVFETICHNVLNGTKEAIHTHQNHKHIWAEISVALSSGLVLYPAILGLHYLRTKNLGLFSRTKASSYAQKLSKEFQKLNNEESSIETPRKN